MEARRIPAGQSALDLAGPVLPMVAAAEPAVIGEESAALIAVRSAEPIVTERPGAPDSTPDLDSPGPDEGSSGQTSDQEEPSPALASAPSTAPPQPEAPTPVSPEELSEIPPGTDLEAALVAVGRAAREWGLRPKDMEGRFVSALMVAIRSVGEVSRAAQAEHRDLIRHGEATARAERDRARELARAAEAALGQARSAIVFAQAEQERVVAMMVEKTLPLFAKNLRDVMVIREQRWNRDQTRRRYAVGASAGLAIFLCGYGLCVWSDWTRTSFAEACLAHPIGSHDRVYCDVTALAGSAVR